MMSVKGKYPCPNDLKGRLGLTLIELMVSIAISACLFVVCLELFVLVKKNARYQQGVARIQENARIVDVFLGEPIRTAGNMGCSAFREDVHFRFHPTISAKDYGIFPPFRIQGVSASSLSKNALVSSSLMKRLVRESDILWIKRTHKPFLLAKSTRLSKPTIFVSHSPLLKKNQIIALSSCVQAEFFRVLKDYSPTHKRAIAVKLLENDDVFTTYPRDTQLSILKSELYYLGDTYRKNIQQQPIHSLYRTDLNGRTIELIEGVEYFFVEYGILNQGDIVYAPQSLVRDWSKIAYVRIKLLLTSIDETCHHPKSYRLRDKTITPKDRIDRCWFTFEWSVRGDV